MERKKERREQYWTEDKEMKQRKKEGKKRGKLKDWNNVDKEKGEKDEKINDRRKGL